MEHPPQDLCVNDLESRRSRDARSGQVSLYSSSACLSVSGALTVLCPPPRENFELEFFPLPGKKWKCR